MTLEVTCDDWFNGKRGKQTGYFLDFFLLCTRDSQFVIFFLAILPLIILFIVILYPLLPLLVS